MNKEYYRKKAQEHYKANKESYRVRNAKKRLANRSKLIEFMGGKCSSCGYSRCTAALDMHHLNPKLKTLTFGNCGTFSWKRLEEEAKLCILLCANCHRELENNYSSEIES